MMENSDEMAQLRSEVERLRELAATCYAGLGAECNLPEAWLDVLNAAANGEPFSTDGLLPYTAERASSGPGGTPAETLIGVLQALVDRSMLGVSIRYRREGTDWPGPWKIEHHSTKWTVACQSAYGLTIEDALRSLLLKLHEEAGWCGGWPVMPPSQQPVGVTGGDVVNNG